MRMDRSPKGDDVFHARGIDGVVSGETLCDRFTAETTLALQLAEDQETSLCQNLTREVSVGI